MLCKAIYDTLLSSVSENDHVATMSYLAVVFYGPFLSSAEIHRCDRCSAGLLAFCSIVLDLPCALYRIEHFNTTSSVVIVIVFAVRTAQFPQIYHTQGVAPAQM